METLIIINRYNLNLNKVVETMGIFQSTVEKVVLRGNAKQYICKHNNGEPDEIIYLEASKEDQKHFFGY